MISIGESRQKKFKLFSRLTELVEGVGHSHVFVSWKDAHGLRWVAEARGSGVRVISNFEFKRHSEVINVYHYGEGINTLNAVTSYVWGMTARRYGWKQIAGLFYMRAGNAVSRVLTGKNRHKNPFRDGEASQICCEFAVNAVCITLGIKHPEDLDSFGLVETRKFNEKHGKKQSKELLARINGST